MDYRVRFWGILVNGVVLGSWIAAIGMFVINLLDIVREAVLKRP
jgi:hypothetical protein